MPARLRLIVFCRVSLERVSKIGSTTVKERAFLQARVKMQNKWASAPVPRRYTNSAPVIECQCDSVFGHIRTASVIETGP